MPNRVDAFLAYVRDRQGPPPAVADSWGALAERLSAVPPEVLEDRFSRVESVFEVDTAGDDYESWSVTKRMAANADAVSALYEAEAAGGAGPELRRRMFAYTGMGGMGGDIGVLPDVFPREYVAASQALQDQKYGKVTGSTELMERLLDQFFTPVEVCNALWSLVQRTNPRAASAVEPSAGIGRMLRTAPSTYQWLANEIDPLMSRMLRMCFPDAEVSTGPFEKVKKRVRADLVVGNPPYGKRPPEMLRLDRPDEGDMVHYFIDRGVTHLNPGGTLAYVVPYAFLINQGGRQFRERLLTRTVFRGAAILPSGTFPSVKAGTFALVLFTRRYQDIQPAAFDEREQLVVAGGYPQLPEAPQSVCGGVWVDSPWRDGRQYLKGEPDLSRIHALFLSPGPAAPEVRTTSKGKTGAAGAGPSPGADRPMLGWRRRKAGPVTFTRETEGIRDAIVESGLLDAGFRASLVLAGFPGPKGRPEVLPVNDNTVQISIPTWFGAFVASQIERVGDRYEVLAASGVSAAGGKMTPRVGSRWAATTLAEVPAWAFRDMAKAWRPAPADLNRLAGRGPLAQLVLDYLSRHLDAVEPLNVGGGFIARPQAGDPLFVQWARGGPGAAYLSVSSLSAKDTTRVLTSAVLMFPDDVREPVSDPLYVVQGGQPTDPQAHADLDTSWSRALRTNGILAAAPGVFAPDPDATVLRGGPAAANVVASAEPAEPDADTTALVDELRVFVRAMANDPAQAEAQRQAIRTRLLNYLGTHGNPHPSGPPILRALTRPDGTLEPVLDQPIVSGLDSEPPSDGTFTEIVEWWSGHRGYALPTDFAADPEEVLGAAIADENVCVEIEGETTRIYAKWAYFQGSPVTRLRAIDDLLGAGVPLDPRLVEKLTGQKDQVLTRWKNQRTLGEMDVTPRSPFVPLACTQDWINWEVWGGVVPPTEAPQIKLLVNDGIMTIDPADAGLRYVTESRRIDQHKWDLLHWLLGYWSRETLVADMEAQDGGGKRTHGGASAEQKIRIDADNVEKFLTWLGTSPWADTVEAEYNNLFAPALADEYPTSPVEIPGQSREVRLHPHQNQVVRRLTMGGHPGSLLFAGDVGSGKCRTGNSLSLTNRGLTSISYLFGAQAQGPEPELVLRAPEDLRIVQHVDGKARWAKVKALYRQRLPDNEPTYIVSTTRASRDEVTGAHPLPVARGDGRIDWVPAAKLAPGDFLVVPAALPEPEGARDDIPDALLELIGWQIGDGSEAGGTAVITQKDVTVLEELQRKFESLFDNGRTTTGLRQCRIVVPSDGKHVPYLTISSPEYQKALTNLGYPWGTNSGRRKFPDLVFGLTNRALRVLLSAYFDADGYTMEDRCGIEVSTASVELADQLRYLLLRFGVRTTRAVRMKSATNSPNQEKRPYQYLNAYGEDAVAFGDHIGFGIPWKQERLVQAAKAERNPNVGIPIRGLVNELAECGVSIRMLTGFLRRMDTFVSAGRPTIRTMIESLRRRMSDVGLAEARRTTQGRKTAELIERHRTKLKDIQRRLQALHDAPVRYELVESVTEVPREPGVPRFVYDLQVDSDVYDDQNYVAGDGGLIMHNTFAGIATAVRWKATGVCRRPLVVVPVSVMAKWESDAQRMFPNLRIGVIGITRGESRGGKVTYRSDEPGERLEKWYRFAAGAYDLTIVGHQAFFRDLEPDEADVLSMLHTVAWTRKQAGAKIAELNRANEREAVLIAERERVAQVVDYHSFRTLFPKAREKSAEEFRRKNLARIDAEILKIQAARESVGALGTDKEVSQVSIAIREMMEGKKYRPQVRVLADGSTIEEDDEESPADGEEEKPEKAEAQVVKEPLPGLLMFSDIGVDGLVLDEAHKLKNLWFPQNKIEYAGAGQDKPFGVKAPWDMFFKTWMIRRKHGGSGGVLFLTATPMTNSPLELYSLLSMVSPKVFEDAKIYDKEQFIDRYWHVESKMVVKPGGTVERAPALIGFKNLDELRGLIAPAFDRKSNAYLVQAGWVKEQPESETKPIDLPRDPAQTAIVRTLVAIRAAWLDKTDGGSDDEEEGSAGPNVLAGIVGIKMRWGVHADGELYERGEISEKDKPKEMSEDKKARTVFRLVWMSMLDKAATDPRLILSYAAEVPERLDKYRAMEERYHQYVADKAAGKKVKKNAPRRPSPSDYMTVDLASALLNQLDLAGVAAYYSAHPVVNKVAMLAKIIAANANDPKRCAHVVFSDDKEIHEDIRRAVVDATKRMGSNAVTADRIAAITGDTAKQRRLTLSQEFNGLDGLGQEITPRYDVMIGTTKAMGEGIDLQRRSCAVHHINLPWTPADLIQRNGRAVRQGNRRGFVSLFYYQTQRTFDGVRYDKVARKAAWWDQMFDGNSATNNPATSSDESDLDETILRMVIEDEEELESRLAELRAAKAERYRAEVYGKIRKAWNTLNATFKAARETIDPVTREHRFRGAMARRDAFLVKFPEFGPTLSQAIHRLNDEPVMLSFPHAAEASEGTDVKPPLPLSSGMVVAGRKILSIAANPLGMTATLRGRGVPIAEVKPEGAFGGVGPDELGAPWSFRDEADSLLRVMNLHHFAELSPDLWPHATSLWRGWLTSLRDPMFTRVRGPSMLIPRVTPLLLGPTPAGESVAPVFLIDTGELSAESFLMGQHFSEKMDEVQVILPVNHPEGWAAWIRAFRADRLYATNFERGYPKRAIGLSIARKSVAQWEAYVSGRFRKRIPAADMAQRLKLTHENK